MMRTEQEIGINMKEKQELQSRIEQKLQKATHVWKQAQDEFSSIILAEGPEHEQIEARKIVSELRDEVDGLTGATELLDHDIYELENEILVLKLYQTKGTSYLANLESLKNLSENLVEDGKILWDLAEKIIKNIRRLFGASSSSVKLLDDLSRELPEHLSIGEFLQGQMIEGNDREDVLDDHGEQIQRAVGIITIPNNINELSTLLELFGRFRAGMVSYPDGKSLILKRRALISESLNKKNSKRKA